MVYNGFSSVYALLNEIKKFFKIFLKKYIQKCKYVLQCSHNEIH